MRHPHFISVLAFAAMVGAAATAEETAYTIDVGEDTIAGILNLPESDDALPIVLMLHGFTGQKNEIPVAGRDMGLYEYTAAALAEAGIASLRFDFIGSGESTGDWSDTTFSGQIDDAIRVFDHLADIDGIDPARIGILGYSQGGLVGAHLAAERPDAKAVVLWAPVTTPLVTYTTILGEDIVSNGLGGNDGDLITADLPWGGSTTLAPDFYKELPLMSTAAAVANYAGPLRVIVGLEETIVTPQPFSGVQLLMYHEGIEDLVSIASDHDFGALSSPDLVDAELIPSTVGWFEEHL